LVYRVPR
jgi:flagellar biosynthesis/type III secretory pathway protein FliH